MNIASNFYPVTTAIALVDKITNMQLLVMNDRC